MNVPIPDQSCATTTGTAKEIMSDEAAAYQLISHSSGAMECFRCGASYDGSVSWGLVDPATPENGVYVRYNGGNTCSAGSPTKRAACDEQIGDQTYCRRSLTVKFVCNNRISEIQHVESVQELAGCEYEVILNSQYGCESSG